MAFHQVAKVSDIANRSCRKVEVGGRQLVVVNLDGAFYALDDRCTHADASMAEGEITGDEIMCPLHFATFEVRTGRVTGPPADEDLMTYPVRVTGDDIEVEL